MTRDSKHTIMEAGSEILKLRAKIEKIEAIIKTEYTLHLIRRTK